MKPNLAPLTQAILNSGTAPRAASRLVRTRPSPMALEQRFMFDGAVAGDVAQAMGHGAADFGGRNRAVEVCQIGKALHLAAATRHGIEDKA